MEINQKSICQLVSRTIRRCVHHRFHSLACLVSEPWRRSARCHKLDAKTSRLSALRHGLVNPNGARPWAIRTRQARELRPFHRPLRRRPRDVDGRGDGCFAGLTANTLFHMVSRRIRLVTNFGLDATFTTLAGAQIPPTVTTLDATNITIIRRHDQRPGHPNGAATAVLLRNRCHHELRNINPTSTPAADRRR